MPGTRAMPWASRLRWSIWSSSPASLSASLVSSAQAARVSRSQSLGCKAVLLRAPPASGSAAL